MTCIFVSLVFVGFRWFPLVSVGFPRGGFWKRETVSGVGTGGGKLASFAPLIALAKGDLEKSAALPRWLGYRHILPEGGSPESVPDLLGLGGSSGNIQWRGPSSPRQPSRMLCPSGWMTDTAVLVNTILQPRSANGPNPNPMRVLGKEGIT